jgi:hypothetical protein
MKDELCVRESGMKRLQFKWNPARDAFENMEHELVGVFDRVLHSDYPNPERIGCPGTDILQKLVISPETFASESTLRHLGRCAPCVDELKKLRLKVNRHRIDPSW